MREIKFKMWDSLENKMHGPYPLHDIDGEWILHGRLPLQFTGLKDKNGADIYEGDIVIFENNILTVSPLINIEFRKSIGKMAWDDKACSYRVFDSVGKYYVWCNELIESMEVIGNVHEHSELLEPKEESTK